MVWWSGLRLKVVNQKNTCPDLHYIILFYFILSSYKYSNFVFYFHFCFWISYHNNFFCVSQFVRSICIGFRYLAKSITLLVWPFFHVYIERFVLSYTVLYCTVLYCTVLYCTVLYCTVLYCTVLYCTVLCCRWLRVSCIKLLLNSVGSHFSNHCDSSYPGALCIILTSFIWLIERSCICTPALHCVNISN